MCSLTCSDAINWEKHELLHTVLDAIDMIPYSQVCSKRTHSIQVKDRRSELWEYTLECVLLECVLLQVKDRRSELWEYTLECVLLECVLLQVKDRRSELWEYTL